MDLIGGSDSTFIEGLGDFYYNSGACSDSYWSNEKTLTAYRKGTDSCGSAPQALLAAINYNNNCISARNFYDVKIGDEFLFERKIERLPTEYIYRKVVGVNYFNNNKSLQINYQDKIYQSSAQLNCPECLESGSFSVSVNNLDTCYISNDKFLFDYDIAIIKSMQTSIGVSYQQYFFNESYFANISCPCAYFGLKVPLSINHDYYLGLGYLTTKKYGKPYLMGVYQNSCNCEIDTTNLRDTTETLLYINNKFYNSGNLPEIFTKIFKNETANYISIMPNPVHFGDDVYAYKTQTSTLKTIAIVDELARYFPSIQNPTCNQTDMTFIIPHQFLHLGLNMIAFEFDDGHKEVSKVIVY